METLGSPHHGPPRPEPSPLPDSSVASRATARWHVSSQRALRRASAGARWGACAPGRNQRRRMRCAYPAYAPTPPPDRNPRRPDKARSAASGVSAELTRRAFRRRRSAAPGSRHRAPPRALSVARQRPGEAQHLPGSLPKHVGCGRALRVRSVSPLPKRRAGASHQPIIMFIRVHLWLFDHFACISRQNKKGRPKAAPLHTPGARAQKLRKAPTLMFSPENSSPS